MLIRVHNLSIAFDDKVVVHNVSFDIHENEIFTLMGESGSGKSVTCLSIMQLLKGASYPEGEILFEGRNLIQASQEALRSMRGKEISYVPQEPSLNPTMPVYRQIQEVFSLHNMPDKTDELLNNLDLILDKKIYPHELSGGQKQRVMIAQALALNPKLIIADEPPITLL